MAVTPELIRKYIDDLNQGDISALSGVLAEDFVQEWPQSGERVRNKEACLNIIKNYPGGSPTMAVRRVTGSGEHWAVELDMDYGGKQVFGITLLDFRGDKVAHETDYWGDPFPAPDWRAQWVEKMEPVHA